MRILYLCCDLGVPVLGAKGAGVHVRELVAAFVRGGHSVVLAAPTLVKSPWDEPAETDANVLHIPPPREFEPSVRAVRAYLDTLGISAALHGELRAVLSQGELLDRLTRRFEKSPPHLIYERASLFGTAGAELARVLDVPRVVELNAPLAEEQSSYRGAGFAELGAQAERWTLASADAIVTVSGPLRDYVLELGIPPERVHVMPNGVDTARFADGPRDDAVRRRWGFGPGPVLGFVGSLRSWHGTESLPPLLKRLRPRHPEVQLVVAGDGPLRDALELEFDRHGVRDNVLFTGWLPHEQVPGLMRQFDVALAPYSEEEHLWYASPMKLFEYMACGRPVVAPALGQIREVVRDGETGLLYAHDDREGLVRACERLLRDRALRERLGAAAAAELDGRYSWDANAARVAALGADLATTGSAR